MATITDTLAKNGVSIEGKNLTFKGTTKAVTDNIKIEGSGGNLKVNLYDRL
jgi:hypothetical protein